MPAAETQVIQYNTGCRTDQTLHILLGSESFLALFICFGVMGQVLETIPAYG